jgi:hypothetical protein
MAVMIAAMGNQYPSSLVFAAGLQGLAALIYLLATSPNSRAAMLCDKPGAKCADGTIYAGNSADGSSAIYTTPEDVSSLLTWNSGEKDLSTVVGAISETNGQANTANLRVLSGKGTTYRAADYCSTLHAYSHSDWYLPARDELNRLYENRSAIGNFESAPGALYWSSSEYSSIFAWSQNFNSGFQSGDPKDSPLHVRCVRKVAISPNV